MGAGAGVSLEPSDMSTADVHARGVRRGRRMLRADRKPNASRSSPFALSSSHPPSLFFPSGGILANVSQSALLGKKDLYTSVHVINFDDSKDFITQQIIVKCALL